MRYMSGGSLADRLKQYGSVGAGGTYEPLPLREITNAREKPQPILRPAIPGG
jgi:hypothetical protein